MKDFWLGILFAHIFLLVSYTLVAFVWILWASSIVG